MFEVDVSNEGELLQDPLLRHAVRVIESTYGDKVSVDAKDKDLLKYGRNTIPQDKTTIMTLAGNESEESYVSDNLITHLVSDNASDSTTTLTLEGHTIDGNDLTFVTQTVVVNGLTTVALETPLARATRLYVSEGTEDLEGNVYVHQNTEVIDGEPGDSSKVHIIIPSGFNQSQKASTSISATDYWIVTNFYADILERANSFGIVELQVRGVGGVFRDIATVSCSDGTRGVFGFHPYAIIPKNSDIRLQAQSDTDTGGWTRYVWGYTGLFSKDNLRYNVVNKSSNQNQWRV